MERAQVLELVRLRTWCWSPAQIATMLELDVEQVHEVLAPFEPVTAIHPRAVSADRADLAAEWIRARRAGEGVSSIGRRYGVHHEIVRQNTRTMGPYPPVIRPRTERAQEWAQEWAQARREGRSAAQVAVEAGVPADRVRRVTAALGPFPHPKRLPADLLSVADLARIARVADVTALGWSRRPDFPAPLEADRRVWRAVEIQDWVRGALVTCPSCGALSLSLTHHARMAHRPRPSKHSH